MTFKIIFADRSSIIDLKSHRLRGNRKPERSFLQMCTLNLLAWPPKHDWRAIATVWTSNINFARPKPTTRRNSRRPGPSEKLMGWPKLDLTDEAKEIPRWKFRDGAEITPCYGEGFTVGWKLTTSLRKALWQAKSTIEPEEITSPFFKKRASTIMSSLFTRTNLFASGLMKRRPSYSLTLSLMSWVQNRTRHLDDGRSLERSGGAIRVGWTPGPEWPPAVGGLGGPRQPC